MKEFKEVDLQFARSIADLSKQAAKSGVDPEAALSALFLQAYTIGIVIGLGEEKLEELRKTAHSVGRLTSLVAIAKHGAMDMAPAEAESSPEKIMSPPLVNDMELDDAYEEGRREAAKMIIALLRKEGLGRTSLQCAELIEELRWLPPRQSRLLKKS